MDSLTDDDVDRISEAIGMAAIESPEEISIALRAHGFSENAIPFLTEVLIPELAVKEAVEKALEEEGEERVVSELAKEEVDEYVKTEAEDEEQRRLAELKDSAHMKSEEEAGIIRRVGTKVIEYIKEKILGWLRR